MRYLRQSTAAVIPVGGFYDKTDGITPETALADQSANGRLIKNGTGAAFTADSWAHDSQGQYLVGLTTAHTDTIGQLRLSFADAATFVPVWEDFTVLDEAVYDVLFGTTAISTLAGTAQTGDAFARLGAPAGASVSADVAAVKVDTAAILVDTGTTLDARIPAALVGGRMDSSVGAVAANAITAAAIATDAIDADAIAADAVTEIQSGLSTLNAAGVRTAVGLASANLDTQLDAIPTVAENADGVWDEAIAGHLAAGSTGEKLNAAGSAGDPWTTALPGAYGAGSAGKIVGDNLNATVSSRSSHSAADVWASGTRTLTSFGTLVADVTTAVWAAGTRSLTTFGTLVADTVTAIFANTINGETFTNLLRRVRSATWGDNSLNKTTGVQTMKDASGATINTRTISRSTNPATVEED